VALQEANVELARLTYNRARTASRSGGGYVAPLELDQDRAAEDQARANLDLARANLDTAQINLDYTEVRAPIRGRISRRMVDERNVVVADNTMLTTILSEDRLYAYFDVDERAYLDLVGENGTSQGSWLAGQQFPVMMRLANEEDFKRSGVVDFIDNRVNGATGTIRMRGVFDNSSGGLKAGMFVRIKLQIGRQYRGVLVPDVALQSDQGRKYVYVVNKDVVTTEDGKQQTKEVVEYRPVEIGQVIDGLRVIKPAKRKAWWSSVLVSGVGPEDRVIIVGMQRVRAGSEVKPDVKAPPPPPKSPFVELSEKRQPVPVATRPTN
jgi:multidrug efflux system membrane fusion protein